MGNHALIIASPGSPGAGGDILRGTEHDADATAEALARRGFEITRCTGPAATRDGIVDAYRALADRCAPGDAAVVYYSGHGFHAYADGEVAETWQGIVPVDFAASTDDFRGISAWELSILQAALTARTRNATVILDCCHASFMSRDSAARAAVPRALPHPVRRGFPAHLAALRARYGDLFTAAPALGNPDAVRLVACAQSESAYEYPGAGGRYRGAFTEALLAVLAEVGDGAASWAAIAGAARGRVQRAFAAQRPDVEGPAHRRPFSLVEVPPAGAVAVRGGPGGRVRLGTGRLAGVERGDLYGVMPLGAAAYAPAAALAEVRVERVDALSAEAAIAAPAAPGAATDPGPALPADAVAFPLERQAPRRPVAVDAPPEARAEIAAALEAARTLRAVEPGAPGEPPLATLRLAGAELLLEDAAGPLLPPARFPEELALAVKHAANLCAAQRLRELEGSHGVYPNELEVELGALVRGEPVPLPPRGAALGLGDRFYLKLRNTTSRRLYVHVFDVGLRGRITLLTADAPAGIPLDPGAPAHVLGRHFDGSLPGVGLHWPEGLPRDTFPRIEELVVIATPARVDLHGLETAEHLPQRRGPGTPLQDLVAQIQDGLPRDVRDAGAEAAREAFLLARRAFLLHPREAAMAERPGAFELDENPLGLRAARVPEAWLARGAAPDPAVPRERRIAIRIAELVVERNRALGSADVRVDALVCTRARDRRGTHVAWTQKFQRVGDGERLALDHGLVFHGLVHDFVDICLWVSRDTEGSLELSRLLSDRISSPELQDAAGTLLTAAGASAAPWVAAAGASAVVARIAYELILGASGKSIGLYRTSFLAHERFGAGRRPAAGLHRAKDFSFALAIDDVTPGE